MSIKFTLGTDNSVQSSVIIMEMSAFLVSLQDQPCQTMQFSSHFGFLQKDFLNFSEKATGYSAEES